MSGYLNTTNLASKNLLRVLLIAEFINFYTSPIVVIFQQNFYDRLRVHKIKLIIIMRPLKKFYQVIIVGAGPVGGILAVALSKSPYIQSLLLIQKQKEKLDFSLTGIPDQRVYSINNASIKLMASLGLLQHISANRIGSMNKIQVWNDESAVTFSQNSMSKIIENNNILNAISKQVAKSPKIEIIYDKQIIQLSNQGKSAQIVLKSGEILQSKLLVGSDGNKSKVKQFSNLKTYGWNYNQTAIVCTLSTDNHITTAFQKYYHNNVLAVLPLWENYCSIVWSVENPLYDYLIKQNDQQFVTSLRDALFSNQNMKIQLPNITAVLNKRLAFPLSTLQSQRYISSRVALIGDAAHSIHPMAGLGVNAGMADAAILANTIILNKKCGNDIGQEISLKNYELAAKKLNYSNSLAMESIKKLFEIQNPFFNQLRKFGLDFVNQSDLLKDNFIQLAKKNVFFPSTFQWEE